MTPTPDQTPDRHDCDNTIRITQYPIYKDGTHEVVSCGCGQVISDALYETVLYVRAKKRHEKIDQMESELTSLRARLAEAEKVRDAAYREAEILRTNATYVKKVLDCANRYMPDLVKGAITVEEAIQERDALRATNATLAERVRNLEEALNAADSVMWMAERYAEGGGANGPEMRDYLSATRIVLKVRGSYHNPSPTPGAAVGKEGE